MKTASKPGDLFNAYQAKRYKTKKKDNPLSKGTLKMVAPSYLRGRNIRPIARVGGKAVGKGYKFKKHGLRPADAVVKSEQNASHQFYKKHKRAGKKKKAVGGVSKATASDMKKYPSLDKVKPTSEGQKALNRMNSGDTSGLKMIKPNYLRGQNIRPLTRVGGKAVGAGHKFKKGMKCKMKHKHNGKCR